jgi:hypothetical protein
MKMLLLILSLLTATTAVAFFATEPPAMADPNCTSC